MKKKEVKKKKEHPFLDKIKEIWAVPRYKAIIKLSLYALFFVGIFTIFNFGNRKEEGTTIENKTLSAITNYEYTYTFQYMNPSDEPVKTFHIEGKRYQDLSLFTILENSQTYVDKKGVLYLEDTNLPVDLSSFFFDLSKISPDKISSYIDKMTQEYQTNFTGGMIKKNYITTVSSFAKLYMGEEIGKEGTVNIETYEKENIIQKVFINMNDYIGMNIEITYQNINKVKDFSKQYPNG